MNDMLTRILLSIVMLPLATALYITLAVWFDHTLLAGRDGLLVTGIITGALTLLFWLCIWRNYVRWTRRRRLHTFLAVPIAIAPTLGLAVMISSYDWTLIAPVAAIAIWLLLTLLIWKETTAERTERLQACAGKALFCPKCGYSMTGLYESRCPECGERFTLDRLMAAQQQYRTEDLLGGRLAGGPGGPQKSKRE